MKLPKLNVRLLRRVARHIKAKPRRYIQTHWIAKSSDSPCGTQACIAGWAVLLSTPKKKWHRFHSKNIRTLGRLVQSQAKKLLGLTASETSQLFSWSNQQFQDGRLGVEEAGRKIEALIKDREAFGEGQARW